MPKQKKIYPVPTPPECRESMGLSPAVLANRVFVKKNTWCPNPQNIEYDRWCDPNEPKTIYYGHVLRADSVIRNFIPMTPLMKSRCCKKFNMDLYLKIETIHCTGSFHERSAIYVLRMLTDEQRSGGVYTASVGNWAMALAYYAQKMNVKATVVLPELTAEDIVSRCNSYGANVVIFGKTIAESKRHAFVLIAENNRIGTYINGYDHPHVIAGAGTIGLEILSQVHNPDAILVPIGGGGLIAGLAAAVKHKKPNVKIYGIEPPKCCSFFKAMDNERPYIIKAEKGLSTSLTVPKAGDNAFHTAVSLIDKMVLVDDDWTARAILHLAEEEKLIAEGAGAISLGALLATPDILPELHGKKVVCIISGANIGLIPLTKILTRAKTVEGRNISVSIRLNAQQTLEHHKIFNIIKNVGCNLLQVQMEHEWIYEDISLGNKMSILCETKDLKHACTLKRVLERIFPNLCEFQEEAYGSIQMCSCFPRKVPVLL